jgi:DNA mismatch repair ATPase MutS
LLDHPVANSITIDEKSVLVSGSNMSGKTTFIRTLGVAAVLAESIDTVPAELWEGERCLAVTSIGRADSLLEGKSYYLAEVERVRDLLTTKGDGVRHLFLLDEIFRGTNTVERVAAGKAVLRELNRGEDIVVVATHDIELIHLLADDYTAYHFREEVDGDDLRFDYTIKPGPSSTRNALALLRTMKFPESVLVDANATAESIDRAMR